MNSLPQIKEIDYRAPGSDEREGLFSFLDKQLRPSVSFSLREEYPSVFKNTPGGKSLFVCHDGKPVSHVAYTSRLYQHSLFEMKVGLVGSVATHEAHRRRGLATELLGEACERLKQEGCVLAILWSDQPDFYKSLGFYRSGLELNFSLSPQSVLVSKRKARLMREAQDSKAIFDLYQRHEGRIIRSFTEMEGLLKIPELQVFVTEKDGSVDSYIAINKGLDFPLTIHEWGGNCESVMENISYCQGNYFPHSSLNLMAPATEKNQIFSQIARSWGMGSLGLVKLLSSEKLLKTWHSYLAASCLKTQQKSLKDEESILFAVLGRDGENCLQALPFFLWGFDSI